MWADQRELRDVTVQISGDVSHTGFSRQESVWM